MTQPHLPSQRARRIAFEFHEAYRRNATMMLPLTEDLHDPHARPLLQMLGDVVVHNLERQSMDERRETLIDFAFALSVGEAIDSALPL